MTHTIPNVPRELKPVLAMILNALDRDAADGKQARAEMAAELRALLSSPSPAGVDGLEVVGWYTEDHLDDKSATTYSREVADRWLAKGWPVNGIANAAAAQAIIDGLRGEVGAQRVKTCAALKARNDAHEERDQQAQRIGELEGLLREERTYASVSASCRKGVVSRCICRNCRLLRIAAALSSGKEGE